MKTLIDLFYEIYLPRKRQYGLQMSRSEKEGEYTIRISKNEGLKRKEIIKVIEEDRNLCFHKATKELMWRFPNEKLKEKMR